MIRGESGVCPVNNSPDDVLIIVMLTLGWMHGNTPLEGGGGVR